MTILARGGCFRQTTGGTRTSARRRSIRSRMPSSTSSAEPGRCIRTSARRPTASPTSGVGGSEARVPVTFVDYGDESDDGFGAERGYPIPEAAKTQPNFIEGGRGRRRQRRRSPPADRRSRSLAALRVVRRALDRSAMGSGLGRGVRSVGERAAARRLDVRRCRRPGDPARTGALRRGGARTDPSCAARHACAAPTATCGRRRIAPAAPAARCRWARACD